MSTLANLGLIRRGAPVLAFVTLVFVASKSTAFFAPMLLARGMSVSDYGTFELALAWATPCAIPAGLGLQAAVPYFLLKLNRPESKRVFFLHVAGSSLLLGILAVASRWLPLPPVVSLAILITAIFAAQNIYTALLKTIGRPALASFTEVAVYCMLFLFVGVLTLARLPITMSQVFILLLATAGAFAALSVILYRGEEVGAGLYSTFSSCFAYGRPIILSSMLGILLMSGGRILIGALLGVREVAVFSLLFRMAAAAIVVHQLVTTIVFAKMYKLDSKRLNYLIVGIQTMVLLAATSIAVVGHPIGQRIFPLLRANPTLFHQVLFAICVQMVYWSTSSQCEMLFYRENHGSTYAKWLGVVFVLLVTGCYALKFGGHVTLMSLANWQMTITFIAGVGGFLLLWRRSMRLPAPLLFSLVLFVVYWMEYGSFVALHPVL